MDSKGMLIGEKGVKYGLQKPAAAKKPAGVAAPSTKLRPTDVFGADSDSDEDIGAQVARQAEKKRAAAKVQQVYEAALTDDPSIFDYDGVYDSLQQARVQPRQQEKIERKSRYIAQLKEQAEQRKRESDIAFERKALKDRVKEDHLFADKEVFVTGAYRRKLEEQQKWLEDQKRKEEEEQRNDVRKVGHMGNFYANLLSKNVAFGTSTSTKDTPPKDQGQAEATVAAAAGQDPTSTSEGVNEETAAKAEPSEAELVAAAAKAGVSLDKYELMRLQAEKARKQRQDPGSSDGAGIRAPTEQLPDETGPEGRQSEQPAAAEAQTQVPTSQADIAAGGTEDAAAEPAPVSNAAKRRNDESAVLSAKERYLARKKQALGQ